MIKKILTILLVLDLLILNILLGYVIYRTNLSLNSSEGNQFKVTDATKAVPTLADENLCPSGCIDLMDSEITKISTKDVGVTPTPTIKVQTKSVLAPSVEKVRSTSYLPIPGSGSTLSNDWVSLEGTDFYLSTSDYPGLLSVYFEANIKLKNGNGEAYVRLYDVTNSRGVDASTLKTSSQISVFVSGGPISLWSGYNHYKVQAKSLTADTSYFESGRLKIISEN